MKQYLDALKAIQSDGTDKPAARENMPGTKSLFGYQMDPIDLSKGFPLLTTKKISFKHIVVELLWFLKGDTNIKYLIDNGVNIWNEDAYAYYLKILKTVTYDVTEMSYKEFVSMVKDDRSQCTTRAWFDGNDYKLGDCGQQYGAQWRNFNGETDQIANLVKGLKESPMSRRHIVSAWNPTDIDNKDLALEPCHTMFQFNCRLIQYNSQHPELFGLDLKPSEVANYVVDNDCPKYYLDCKMYQRSADSFLGVPYNIASYALLTNIIAEMCGMVPGIYTQTFGDLHIYENHYNQANEQLERIPTKLPTLMRHVSIGPAAEIEDIQNWTPEMFHLDGYNPQARIKAPLSTGIKK
tara:strand:- start:825 stop:1877 length:1053 start_codon:yes stop_codon:yes gene_type:complete